MPPLGEVCHGDTRLNFVGERGGCSSFRSTVSLGHNSKKEGRPSITFCETVEVEETLHLNDFSEEEYQAYWISGEEFGQIIDMADIQAELMQQGEPEDPECFLCYRGLEGRSTTANETYEQVYFDMMYAVLYEQENQRELGYYDAESLAALCCDTTKECKLQALQKAQEDLIEAKSYYQLR